MTDYQMCPNCDDTGWRKEGRQVEICGCRAGTVVLTKLSMDVGLEAIGVDNIDTVLKHSMEYINTTPEDDG